MLTKVYSAVIFFFGAELAQYLAVKSSCVISHKRVKCHQGLRVMAAVSVSILFETKIKRKANRQEYKLLE